MTPGCGPDPPTPRTGKLWLHGVVRALHSPVHPPGLVPQTFPRRATLNGCVQTEGLKGKLVTWYLGKCGHSAGGTLKGGKEEYVWPNAWRAEESRGWNPGLPIPCANVKNTPEHRTGTGGQCAGDISKGVWLGWDGGLR